MNKLWGFYATSVNDLQNFKTTTEYENALVWKIFVFQLLNSFLPIVAAANQGMVALQSQMINVFVAKQGFITICTYSTGS
jgi:hypothetical protein